MVKINCVVCGREIVKDHNRRKYCADCAFQKQLEAKRKYQKKWRQQNPDKDRERKRKFYKKNPDWWREYRKKRSQNPEFKKKRREYQKKYYTKIRMMVLKHYGGKNPKCAICGENHIECLGIDHIRGGGNKHRKAFKGRYRSIYEFLYHNGFPEDFRVLCHNCNMSLAFYGYSPYEKNRA